MTSTLVVRGNGRSIAKRDRRPVHQRPSAEETLHVATGYHRRANAEPSRELEGESPQVISDRILGLVIEGAFHVQHGVPDRPRWSRLAATGLCLAGGCPPARARGHVRRGTLHSVTAPGTTTAAM